ncbi:MAG TPA: metallophosphoesterase [Acidimicrobiales bacterium]|nr:metallophosphoesterase [Acidimicrobiales bacterium]
MADPVTRRQLLAAAAGAAGSIAAATLLGEHVWPLLAREDLIPGAAPDVVLSPNAWTEGDDRLSFVAVGDTGSGGRQAMAVASAMAETYRRAPFGLVSLLGDICYYGNFEDRFEHVFARPMRPLIDAGVGFELAIGNHDDQLRHTDESLAEIEAELRLLGTPGLYYATSHGPVDFFYLDSSVPAVFGEGAPEQWEWLDAAMASSANRWKVVALHHPPYSSGRHGSTPGARRVLEPMLRRHAVDLVLAGHDHHYERTVPIAGTTYVVSGGGCKTTSTGRSPFTVTAESTLHFLHVEVEGDRLRGRAVRADGSVADRFELRAREGR